MKFFKSSYIFAVAFAIYSQTTYSQENKISNWMYVGSYTEDEGFVDGKAEGIYTLQQNIQNGKLTLGSTVAKLKNPSFVRVSKDGKYLLSVSELNDKEAESGFVLSYKINKDHSLTKINQLSTHGFAPCHIEIDKTGKFAFVSNYMGGVVMMYEIEENGNLIEKQKIELENPKESHAHSVNITANNKHAYIADLGNDKIWIYDLDAQKGTFSKNAQEFAEVADGAGPRHLSFSRDGKFAYVMNELNSSISTFQVLESGGLQLLQNISSLPSGFINNNSGAEIHVHPTKDFLYSSNRGANNIAVFRINIETGELSLIAHTSTEGKTPRNFNISPDGNFLYAANQDSGSISSFKIDLETGMLNSLGEVLEAKTPVCLEFVE